MKHGDAVQEALREGRRPLPSQNRRRKCLRTRQKPKQARTHVVGRDGVRIQQDREQLLSHLEPKTGRVVESRNGVFIETPSNLLPAARRLSPQQDLESPSCDFSDDTLDDSYVSHDDLLRDMQNYTSALDFGVDTPTGTVELVLPQQTSPDSTSPGGALPAGLSSEGVTPEGSSLPSVPISASAALRATNGQVNRGTVGVTPAVTRSRAASLLPRHTL